MQDPEQVRQQSADAARDLAQKGRQIADSGRQQLEQGKSAAADQVQQLADVVSDAAGNLQRGNSTLAGYAGELASGMQRFSHSLRDRSVDELVGETQQLARRNPAIFLLGSVALGVALSRFMKASSSSSTGGFGPSRANQER